MLSHSYKKLISLPYLEKAILSSTNKILSLPADSSYRIKMRSQSSFGNPIIILHHHNRIVGTYIGLIKYKGLLL